MQSGTDALVSWLYMQGEVAVTVTYKVREAIPLVPTEQQACHVEGDGIAKKKAMARQAVRKATLRRGKVATQLIWAVVEEAWVCQWCRRHRVPCCWILTL
jgi:hypothetical protein